MAISINNMYPGINNVLNNSSEVNKVKLENNLQNINSDTESEELLEACKDFEQYFVEQVMKEFTKSLDEFNNNTYMQYFGDNLISEYAETVTESGNLGMAEMLYESIKSKGYNIPTSNE